MVRQTSPSIRRCEAAVITAYRELRDIGYRIHHPEAPLSEARRLVAEWIDFHIIRKDAKLVQPDCGCGEQHPS